MKKLLGVSLLAAALAACGGGGKDAASPNSATCADAAASVFVTMKDQALQGASADEVAQAEATVKNGITETCTEQAWSPETIACFAKASAPDATMACAEKLTEDQMAAFGMKMAAAFENAGGDPGDMAPDEGGDDKGGDFGDGYDPDDGGE
ncbi:MAG: hypothetical protein R2939_14525 [Kofleriaceae bacterium]